MDESNWYYNSNGQPTGPVNLGDLRQLFASGSLHPSTLVWHSTLVQWMAANQVPGLLPPAPPAPPPPFSTGQPFPPPPAFGSGSGSDHHGMAVVGFVLAIVGFFIPIFGCFLAIPGLILGIVALSGMSRTHNSRGHGLAVAAIVIGAIACLCHCGLWAGAFAPRGDWHYEFHRVPWHRWDI